MLNLISSAYGVSEDNIAGGPGWISLDLFDVIARVPEGTTPATANLMLQSLLSERFGLVVNRGTRPVPRYVLTVGKGGSKLKPASGAGNPSCQPIQQPPAASPAPADQPNIKVACRNLTMAGIADNLHQMANGYFDHDVVDQTKLEGNFDFDIEWTGRGVLAAKGAGRHFRVRRRREAARTEGRSAERPDGIVRRRARQSKADAESLGHRSLSLVGSGTIRSGGHQACRSGCTSVRRPLVYRRQSDARWRHAAADDRDVSSGVAERRRRPGRRTSEVRRHAAVEYHRQGAEHRRGRSQHRARTSAAAAAQRRSRDAPRIAGRAIRDENSH